MTEQQPKPPQIIDIVEMPPTVDIVQSPPTQNGSQTPDTAQIEDILQMAAQLVDMQPLKRALGGNIYAVYFVLFFCFLFCSQCCRCRSPLMWGSCCVFCFVFQFSVLFPMLSVSFTPDVGFLLCILFCFSVLRFVPNVVGVVHPRCRVLVVYFVLLFIFTFLVPCCDSRYDVHI